MTQLQSVRQEWSLSHSSLKRQIPEEFLNAVSQRRKQRMSPGWLSCTVRGSTAAAVYLPVLWVSEKACEAPTRRPWGESNMVKWKAGLPRGLACGARVNASTSPGGSIFLPAHQGSPVQGRKAGCVRQHISRVFSKRVTLNLP